MTVALTVNFKDDLPLQLINYVKLPAAVDVDSLLLYHFEGRAYSDTMGKNNCEFF